MKNTCSALLIGFLALSSGCNQFLDVNTNPNGPQSVSANLYLPPMLHWLVTSPQFDGRFVGHYAQEWYSTTTNNSPPGTWGKMGYDPGSDNGAQQWRDVYWSLGQNLIDMNTKAEAEQRWDLLGVGMLLKAWGWQVLTDLHGEIIVKEAIDQSRTQFDYDTQQYAYEEVQRLLDSAIVLLKRTDGAVDRTYLAVGDHIYNGDRTKWLKLAAGMLALNLNHYSNKATYDPARVIRLVDSSFTSNADDALLAYPCTSADFADCNFWGISRGNINLYRQTQFVVGLMNGTQFGGTVDPRMSRMLAIDSANTTYRGLDINVGQFGALTVPQRPRNFFGYVATPASGSPSRYIFADRSKLPAMTYSELQFIKAEAALRSGNPSALTAYTNGISAHFQFVNDRNAEAGNPNTISAATRDSFLASPNIVPAALTLSHIMSQKYIALWGWGHNELWMDMRRYHYTEPDLVSGTQVFRGFTRPTTLYTDNVDSLVYRIRPRFNSEYVWNRAGLDAIGGLATTYHTKETWITKP